MNMKMDAEPIVLEQSFHAPLELVWQAITDPRQMRRWFFETIKDFNPVAGFETQFNVRSGDRDYLHLWQVAEVDPMRKIVYNWRYGGCAGESYVTWELSETPGGSTLKLTHEGHETFPQDDPAFSRPAGEAGWRYFICESLKAFVEQQQS